MLSRQWYAAHLCLSKVLDTFCDVCLACSWKPSTYDENVSHQEAACQTDYCDSLNDYYEDKIVRYEVDERRFIAHMTYRPALSNLTSSYVNKVTT